MFLFVFWDGSVSDFVLYSGIRHRSILFFFLIIFVCFFDENQLHFASYSKMQWVSFLFSLFNELVEGEEGDGDGYGCGIADVGDAAVWSVMEGK